ncbi:MAG: hypothetical protein ACHQIK_10610 [Candidatus Acidiferrales bacterium]
MRKNIAFLVLLVGASVAQVFAATTSTIIYVNYNGSDKTACTRSTPCKTITHALTVVPVGGVVEIVGSGTYDSFVVTTALTVRVDPGVVATINVPTSGTGITVNAASTDHVTLRGLTLQGSGGSGTGIQINSAGRTTVEDCVSRNLHWGLGFTPSAASQLKITGGSYEGSDTAIFTRAVLQAPGSNVAIDGVNVYGSSGNAAIAADSDTVTITHSMVTGDGASTGIAVNGGSAVLENDVVSGYATGVAVGSEVFMSSCTITGNNVGVIANGFTHSRVNNTIVANGQNVNGTMTPFSPQ